MDTGPRSRDEIRPRFAALVRRRAQGMPGAVAPAVSCARIVGERTRVVTGTTGHVRHSPRDVGRLIPCSPRRTGRSSHRRPQSACELDTSIGVSGPHGFVERVTRTFVFARLRVDRIPAPRFVTIGRNVPLHRGGMRKNVLVICPTRQARTCAADWHDGQNAHGRNTRAEGRAMTVNPAA